MRSIIAIVALLGFAAGPVEGAGAARRADLHLRDGTTLQCLVLGFEDGTFHVRVHESGQERAVKAADVARVTFGKAVGPNVREPEPPKSPAATPPRGTTGPSRADWRRARRARFREHWATLDTRQLVTIMGYWTGRFGDRRRMDWVRLVLKSHLNETRGKGGLERNLKIALLILEVAAERKPAVVALLRDLKRDYPDDPEVRALTPKRLREGINRFKQYAPPRPQSPGILRFLHVLRRAARRPGRTPRDRRPPPPVERRESGALRRP